MQGPSTHDGSTPDLFPFKRAGAATFGLSWLVLSRGRAAGLVDQEPVLRVEPLCSEGLHAAGRKGKVASQSQGARHVLGSASGGRGEVPAVMPVAVRAISKRV